MRNIVFYFALAGIILLASCSKGPVALQYIPDGTMGVMAINPKNLALKGKLLEDDQYQFMKMLQDELKSDGSSASKSVQLLIKNPKKAGVDPLEDMFVTFSGSLMGSQMFSVVMDLKSADDFKTFADGLLEGGDIPFKTREETDGYTQYTLEEGQGAIAWNDEVATVIGLMNSPNLVMLNEQVSSMFSQGQKGLKSNSDFQGFYKSHQDISLWLDMAPVYAMSKMMVGSMPNLDYSDTYLHLFLQFNDADISLNLNTSMNKVLKQMMEDQNLMKEAMSAEMLQSLPKESNMLLGLAVNPDAIMKLLYKQMPNYYDFSQGLKESTGVMPEELMSNLNGDILYSMSDVKIDKVERTYQRMQYDSAANKSYNPIIKDTVYQGGYVLVDETDTTEMPVPTLYLLAALNNNSAIKTLLENSGIPFNSEKQYYSTNEMNFPMYISFTDKMMLITSDETAAVQLQNGGIQGPTLAENTHAATLQQNPFYLFLNTAIQDYDQSFAKLLKENADPEANMLLDMLGDQVECFTMQPYGDDGFTLKLEMTDGEGGNSLERLLTAIDAQVQQATNM